MKTHMHLYCPRCGSSKTYFDHARNLVCASCGKVTPLALKRIKPKPAPDTPPRETK